MKIVFFLDACASIQIYLGRSIMLCCLLQVMFHVGSKNAACFVKYVPFQLSVLFMLIDLYLKFSLSIVLA